MVPIGSKLDLDFEVKIARDGDSETVRFSSLVRGPTIVSVYMRNNTRVCDLQVDALVRSAAVFSKAGLHVVGVSRDTCRSHLRYASAHKVGFTLVSDPDFLFSKAVDAMVEKSMYGRKYLGPLRASYLLDAQAKLQGVVPVDDPAEHALALRGLLPQI